MSKSYPLTAFAALLIVGGFVSDAAGLGYSVPLIVSGIAIMIFCAGVAVGSWATDVS